MKMMKETEKYKNNPEKIQKFLLSKIFSLVGDDNFCE